MRAVSARGNQRILGTLELSVLRSLMGFAAGEKEQSRPSEQESDTHVDGVIARTPVDAMVKFVRLGIDSHYFCVDLLAA
jgi:hypothetical protein